MTTPEMPIVNIGLPSIARTFHTPLGGALASAALATIGTAIIRDHKRLTAACIKHENTP